MRRCSSTRSGSLRLFPLAFTSGCKATSSSRFVEHRQTSPAAHHALWPYVVPSIRLGVAKVALEWRHVSSTRHRRGSGDESIAMAGGPSRMPYSSVEDEDGSEQREPAQGRSASALRVDGAQERALPNVRVPTAVPCLVIVTRHSLMTCR
jgi:hypothetical protein